jgi:hypothetical protein
MQLKGIKVELGAIQDLDKRASKLVDNILAVKTKWNDANMIAKNSAGKLLTEYDQIRNEIIKVEKQMNDIGLVGPKELDDVATQAENALKLIKFVQTNANASK